MSIPEIQNNSYFMENQEHLEQFTPYLVENQRNFACPKLLFLLFLQGRFSCHTPNHSESRTFFLIIYHSKDNFEFVPISQEVFLEIHPVFVYQGQFYFKTPLILTMANKFVLWNS